MCQLMVVNTTPLYSTGPARCRWGGYGVSTILLPNGTWPRWPRMFESGQRSSESWRATFHNKKNCFGDGGADLSMDPQKWTPQVGWGDDTPYYKLYTAFLFCIMLPRTALGFGGHTTHAVCIRPTTPVPSERIYWNFTIWKMSYYDISVNLIVF